MRTIAFLLSVFFFVSGNGQIRVDNAQTAEYYVKNVLLGPGVQVGKVRYVGMAGSLGQFEADPKIIGVQSGLVLTTGNADSILGPNNSPRYTSWGKLPVPLPREFKRGDKDLNRLCGGRTTDVTLIEFDFVPVKNVLEFNYVFASEEYPEYVGSPFNDVFGFFLSVPGTRKKINLAVLPSKIPVSVNNINQRKNKKYFRYNGKMGFIKPVFTNKNKLLDIKEVNKYLQFDGITTVLKVHQEVIPYQKYHMKIAIADVADRIYDSGVFLEAGSFVSIIDTAGKYYEKLEAFKYTRPNIDSILGTEVPADTLASAQIDENFEITDIYFDFDSYSLQDSSKAQLAGLAQYLLDKNTFTCVLYGYTDSMGSKDYNQELSEKRAMTVMNYLTLKGVGKNRLSYVGRNFESPRSDNATDEGRAKNRRVEIIIASEP